eukprot:1157642-Pelagomonas_calceolata.AAC.1
MENSKASPVGPDVAKLSAEKRPAQPYQELHATEERKDMLLEREEIGIAWKATLSWSIFLLSWYFLLQTSLKHVVSPDELARETLFAQVIKPP